MREFVKFYQKKWDERLQLLRKNDCLKSMEEALLRKQAINFSLNDTIVENYITDYTLPEGLSFHYLIDNQKYIIPMVTEEPSVIAASSHGAALVEKAGGFTTELHERLLLGQVIIEKVQDAQKFCSYLETQFPRLLEIANQAHPSLLRRKGGARWLRCRILSAHIISLDLAVDVREAMGANMMNTMLEAVAQVLEQSIKGQVLLSVLSNYATECLVSAKCKLPFNILEKNNLSGKQVADKIALASRVAQLDPYRAATHNKGIMNGIDAVIIATGNDWRAIESGAHAFAARSGQYRGLSTWEIKDGYLVGKITIPAPVGVVGGSIGIVPLVAVNQKLAHIKSARELEKVIASVGLAQNLAALYALVTEGIQHGHMNLQLKSLVLAAGAHLEEVLPVVESLRKTGKRDAGSAKKALQDYRKRRDEQ
ncbi:hydroxymethylglutaryl-CoA reductase, degradative [Liquorilactobacillus oeni]|uniref:3-hydroxy-3-methylglutaryl coenzyme A reductase n=1 Tax=Liquorilactobacillus oeni DSM 19972 TaxID=1423777 RepID=A0A0R1MLW9_9LACO|nr:hydroxymethylglutaryl-CoA reductase, degradative [Liquorilactobacillus oeni]KRL06186.1 3-hydroxy-3-methylglutaryl-coenzyme A reductase 3-hydroxy-3-methylglutaryl-coenzyme Auctase [Liquorilactobacillus oeni DSM 19972]